MIAQCSSAGSSLYPAPTESSLAASQGSLGHSNHIQKLNLVHEGRVYDVRNVVLPVVSVPVSVTPYPWSFLLILYDLGAVGFGLFATSSFYGHAATKVDQSPPTATTLVTFTSSLLFWVVFVACYQRQVLKALISSFDFLFYSSQITTILFTGAWLGRWEPNQSLWLLTSWIWAHWAFCLDALTPLMKAKLCFRVWFAVPILFLQIAGGTLLLYQTFTTIRCGPEHSVLRSGPVFGRHFELHLLPFLVSRLLLACTWSIRLLLRLCRASNADAIILRGAVSYANYLSRSTRRIESRINFRSARISPEMFSLRLAYSLKAR